MTSEDPAVFVLAPRYARDLGTALRDGGVAANIVVRAIDANAAFAASPARIAVIDARGTLATGLIAAHEIGAAIEARHGALLILLARSDAGAVAAAYAAGATQILSSPFGAEDLIDALRFATRLADRLADAAAGHGMTLDADSARRDALTGLASAHHAHVWVDLMLGGGGEPAVIVMLIAVGRFGQINAAYGRTAADALLQAVAERIARIVAEDEHPAADARLVARMSGAEFAVVLPAPVVIADAMRLAQRIVAAFETPFALDGRIVHLAVRTGVATGDADMRGPGQGAERLFRRASAALAEARAGPPGGIELFSADPGGDPITRLTDLESDLRRAIERDEFQIVFQPQVTLADARIAGVEALVRWAHPQFGELSAETLLEVAASAEFAIQLGAHIRAKALREAASWPRALATLQLSVNVTAGDLRAPDFIEQLDAALAASGFARHRLTLEVTESDLIENLEAAATTLAVLRARGVSVALDDFGTGYSSLAYLKALPLDGLKLDKSLTVDLAGSPRDRIVVRGVVDMARALGIRVTAEGVETAQDLDLVCAAACDWYQGFYCSAPLPGHELAAFVAAWDRRRAGAGVEIAGRAR